MKCSKAPVCRHCSTTHEPTTDAEGRISCQKPAFCKNCEGKHGPGSKDCPKFKEEAEIAKIRTEQKISFAEARQKVTAKSATPSFSSTVSQNLASIDPRTRAQESELVMNLKRELAETKKALGEVNEARAAMKELTEARKALAELAEARKAVIEVERLRREIAELKAKNINETTEDNQYQQPLTKTQRKALKKQKQQQQQQQQEASKSDKETTQPERKKSKHHNSPQEELQDKSAQYYKLNKYNLLDDPSKPRRSRSSSPRPRTDRSVSRSPM